MRNNFYGALAALTAFAAAPAFAQCPNLNGDGAVLDYSGSDLRTGVRAQVTAGGDIDMWDCNAIRMPGYLGRNPTVTLDLSDMGDMRVEVVVESECDPTLLIQTPNGQIAFEDDDDETGRVLDPAIVLPARGDGQYDIWVGSFWGSYCPANLQIRTRY